MSALKVAGVEHPASAPDHNESTDLVGEDITLAPRMMAAFAALREALNYAQDLGAGTWDFAVEIATLRRLRLSNNDLRWLVVRGLVEHGVEISGRGDATRSFRHTKRTRFAKGSCFVLTPSGVELAEKFYPNGGLNEGDAAGSSEVSSPRHRLPSERPQSPVWDRNRRELRIGSSVVRRFTLPSINQESILAAFEEQRWPACIADPLPLCGDPARQARLQTTIGQLNRGQKRLLVVFFSDKSGQTIRWKYHDDPNDATDS